MNDILLAEKIKRLLKKCYNVEEYDLSEVSIKVDTLSESIIGFDSKRFELENNKIYFINQDFIDINIDSVTSLISENENLTFSKSNFYNTTKNKHFRTYLEVFHRQGTFVPFTLNFIVITPIGTHGN